MDSECKFAVGALELLVFLLRTIVTMGVNQQKVAGRCRLLAIYFPTRYLSKSLDFLSSDWQVVA